MTTPFDRAKRRVDLAGRREEQIATLKALRLEIIQERKAIDAAILNEAPTLEDAVFIFEKRVISAALRRHDGDVQKAARLLGMSSQGLYYSLEHRHPDVNATDRVYRKRKHDRQ